MDRAGIIQIRRKRMKTKILMLLGATACFLAACGGGSSAPAISPPPPLPPPPPATQESGGVWFGTLTNGMITEEYVGITTDDGRFRLVSVDSKVQFHGLSSVTGVNLDGTGRAFADTGFTWLDGTAVVDVTISAIIAERDSWSGAWQNASGESGTFEFFYDDLNDKDSDAALLEGVWTGFDDDLNPNSSFTIEATGSFTGQNTSGCVSSGQISVIDAKFAVYDVASIITGCPIAGTYSGLAVLADIAVPNDLLAITIDDGVRTIVTELLR
jgi:hypothetical protein